MIADCRYIKFPPDDLVMSLMAVAILVLLSALLVLSILFASRKPSLKLPPGPTKLPVVGDLHQLESLVHRSFFRLSSKHGPLMFLKLGAVPAVVASSADAAEAFLRTHDLHCCSRPSLAAAAKLSYGSNDVAFAPYGPRWRELRKVCIVELFSSKKVSKFRSVREEEVAQMISLISSQQGCIVDLSAAMLSVSNDVTCRAAFGKIYYDVTTGEVSKLHKILVETQAMFSGFFVADYFPALGWLDTLTGMRGRLEKNFADLDSFYEKVIDEHTDPVRGEEDRDEDTLDALLRIQKGEAGLTKEHIKAVLMNIFLGGNETTTAAMEWAMAELVQKPRAMKKAQDEVRGLVGTKGKVEESDLPQLRYLKCVVKETMRLHPPIPLLVFRETMRHFEVDGFDIPAGTRVIVNAWAIGRDESSWVAPEEFNPDRFIDSSVDMKGHDFQLVPFGAGRRICPGMHVGLVIVELVLANLLYSFDWEIPEGTERDFDMDETAGLTVHKKSALRLIATKRQNSMRL